MKKQILTLGFVVFSLMLPLKAAAQKVEKIYNFGDSVSDVGNLYNALKLTGTEYPPPPYFKGRFSNGIVWVEYLGQKLKLNPIPYTTLPLGSSNAPDGINYAFGGSSSGYKNVVFPDAPLPGLLAQVGLFTASLAKAKRSADPNALYIVGAGSNDYLFEKVTDPQVPVKNISTAVTALAAVGAKKIMVVNLTDLGKFPATRVNSQLSSQLSSLTKVHNTSLALTLKGLSQTLRPKVNIILLDANTLFNTAIKYPGAFGLKNVTDACLTSVSVCANPNQYLFWDGYHPTTAAHKQLENLAYLVLKVQPRKAQLMLPPAPRTQISQPRLAQLIFSEPTIKD
ncbi:MAG TPA: SGNH/GDSL hydrolase family protein [Coleofasciculaceae cyanobacterium]|jgi:phospholipase/lecithinase/hemolysin